MMAHESILYRDQVTWFTTLVGKKCTFEFMKTYLREMRLGGVSDDHDLLIASGEIEEGSTKRWIIAWKFLT
jgi:23S rRNA A1618 N6-methylase RlmF